MKMKMVYKIAACVGLAVLTTLIFTGLLFPAQSANGSNFVTRSGSQLLLHGRPFRFAGANIYWLGLIESAGHAVYPTHFEVDDALSTAAAMGATVVRSHTLGISVGCPLCLEPSLNTFNNSAFQHIDYAIKVARDYGIRLIIPLVDNWHYYHGGKHTFTGWHALPDENEFYTNPQVISDFEQYIRHILNHVNSYTGVAYKNDPTILAWETGNEISPPLAWTRTITGFIKSLDFNHLIMDGSRIINAGALLLPGVDIITAHYYPMNIAAFNTNASEAVHAHKAFIVGEYDWTNKNGKGDDLASFLTAIERSSAAGDLYWSLFARTNPHDYMQHNDGYTLHYPGDTPDMRRRVQLLLAHARAMHHSAYPAG